ncbi:hypothetical protein BZA05DRAFT_383014 [Tricharina praecox]|uniref:uncharacterized protein n=1 Tax=Tricharina praecox TaxID=43433 RepID=UPI002220379E|nr:uncharacterized protein BZA05DRAFT_383014 [Tricharina praecox]KAI5858991.1 hypothetical protein BZA05DRAFT_383014 [Tricharina praecox]
MIVSMIVLMVVLPADRGQEEKGTAATTAPGESACGESRESRLTTSRTEIWTNRRLEWSLRDSCSRPESSSNNTPSL